jgi:hypothetical protein
MGGAFGGLTGRMFPVFLVGLLLYFLSHQL